MEDTAIKTGFEILKDGSDYDNLYAAASCREKADWIVGLNATRLFSILYGTTLNTGRVQSPTLAMIVNRENAIASFVSAPFYIPAINCGTFTAYGNRIDDKGVANAIRDACEGNHASVLSVERQTKTELPPKLYDLTSLQRNSNRIDGFSAQQTLDYAQSLYEKGIITYPRTDSRYLTADMTDTVCRLVDKFKGLIDMSDFPESLDIGIQLFMCFDPL
jgi:DNA topoisomerase-3